MVDVLYVSHFKKDNQPFFQISPQELALFEGAFAYLREKTGVFIDPYGSCRVYPDHLKILIDYLNPSTEPAVQAFVSFLQHAAMENETLLFEGD